MSWGGHVLYMIQMIRGNARKRPSLKRGFPKIHERDRNNNVHLNYRKIKALSDAERAVLRKRLTLEKRLRTKKSILALVVSVFILASIIWLIKINSDDLIEIYHYHQKI